jgi:hypothetical protein
MEFTYKLSNIQYKKINYVNNKKSLYYMILKKIVIFYFIFLKKNRFKKSKKKFKSITRGPFLVIDHLICTLLPIITELINLYLLKKKFSNVAKTKNNKKQEIKLIVNFYKLFLWFNNMHLSLFLILSAKKIIKKIECYIKILLNSLKNIKQKKNHRIFSYIFLIQQIALSINKKETKIEKYSFFEKISLKKINCYIYALNICIEEYLKNIFKKIKNYNQLKKTNLKKKGKHLSRKIRFLIKIFFASTFFWPVKFDLIFLYLILKYVKIIFKKMKPYFLVFIIILLKKYFLSLFIHFRYLRKSSYLLIVKNLYKKIIYSPNKNKHIYIFFFEKFLVYNESLMLIVYIQMLPNLSIKILGEGKKTNSMYCSIFNFNLYIECLKNISKINKFLT